MEPIGITMVKTVRHTEYGVYEISDAKYYFDMNSRMAVSEVCTDDGVGCYIADKNGQLTQVTKRWMVPV